MYVCVCVCARARTHTTHTRIQTHTEVCRNHGCQVAMVNKFCMVTPNFCESSVVHLLYGTLLVPKIMRWVQDFCKVCAILYIHSRTPILFSHILCFPQYYTDILWFQPNGHNKKVSWIFLHFQMVSTKM